MPADQMPELVKQRPLNPIGVKLLGELDDGGCGEPEPSFADGGEVHEGDGDEPSSRLVDRHIQLVQGLIQGRPVGGVTFERIPHRVLLGFRAGEGRAVPVELEHPGEPSHPSSRSVTRNC